MYRLHGQMSVALQYQLKALAIHEKLGASVSLVQSLNAVAVTYASLDDAKQAKIYYERAIAMADTVAPPVMRSFLRANYGSFLGYHGELARGRDMLADAISNTSPAQRTLRYSELADLDFRLNRLDDALADSDQAVACVRVRADAVRLHPREAGRAAQVQLTLGNEAAAIADHERGAAGARRDALAPRGRRLPEAGLRRSRGRRRTRSASNCTTAAAKSARRSRPPSARDRARCSTCWRRASWARRRNRRRPR